jgi:hypothetical protein
MQAQVRQMARERRLWLHSPGRVRPWSRRPQRRRQRRTRLPLKLLQLNRQQRRRLCSPRRRRLPRRRMRMRRRLPATRRNPRPMQRRTRNLRLLNHQHSPSRWQQRRLNLPRCNLRRLPFGRLRQEIGGRNLSRAAAKPPYWKFSEGSHSGGWAAVERAAT